MRANTRFINSIKGTSSNEIEEMFVGRAARNAGEQRYKKKKKKKKLVSWKVNETIYVYIYIFFFYDQSTMTIYRDELVRRVTK